MKQSVFLKFFFAAICALGLNGSLFAQFHLNGTATQVSDSCFVLTEAQNWSVGSIWFTEKVNLNQSFQVIMELYFGCNDTDGADGIVFGFQPISTSIGENGGGIGFLDISPSLGIEFDTWQNDIYNDPSFDHIAIVKNGDMNHASPSTLAGPIQASPNGPNIEDCRFHELRVNWDADKQELEVWFDCSFRLSYTGDIVNEIFGGDPEVFWGFTSATGGFNNHHEVCFKYTTFLDGFEDVVICPGGQFQLNIGGGATYEWTPATGLSNPNIPNPIAAPDSTTTYMVTAWDECNNPFFDTITVFVDGDTVFFDLGPDTTVCAQGGYVLDATSFGDFSVEYNWSNGATTPTLSPPQSGTYSVTVTIDDYCVSDDRVNIELLPRPYLNLGNDQTLCLGESLVLDVENNSPDVTYLWQDGSTSPQYFVSEPGGLYQVWASNICGTIQADILITYEDCQEVFFPNVFSPNNDGINDVFLPFDGGDVENISLFQVFDRWGGLVFEARNFRPGNFEMGWDGKANGKPATPGVYAWMAEVFFRNGTREIREGSVTLIR